jgi:RNA polymerase sigma-70 factor (ECF subfamily)
MPDAAFATTHWSVVLRAGAETDSAAGRQALEQLCRTYWYPVYAEIRRRGHGEHDAQDLAQDFFACLLRRDSVTTARPCKGRFRSYLLGALDYFLSDARAREQTAKRGGGQPLVSFDELDAESWFRAEPASPDTPARAFDRRWLVALLDASLRELEAEQTTAGKAAQFARLKPFLACETDAGDYRQIAHEMGLKSGTVAVAVHRLRQRYQEIIRDAVRQTLLDPEELDDELRHLFGGVA